MTLSYHIKDTKPDLTPFPLFTATGERYDAFTLAHRGDGGFELIENGEPGDERNHDNTADYGGVDDLNAGSILEQPARSNQE